MPLWKKKADEIPEKFRNLTDEQLLAALEKAEADAAKAADLEGKLASETTEHGKARAALQALEANRPKPGEGKKPDEKKPDPNSNEPLSVFDDEEGAFRQRTEPLAAATIQAGTLAAKAEAIRLMKPDDQRVWRKYEDEINKIMEQEMPARRIYPQVWMNALTFVKGIHMNEILEAAKGGNDLFSEGISDTGKPHDKPKDDEKLSDEELGICKKMRIKPEDYLKRKKGITVVNV